MFDLTACVFRFANVVGARQTHGVGFDFVRRLMGNPKRLPILGDGKQSKSYIHVSDVVSALLLVDAHCKETSLFSTSLRGRDHGHGNSRTRGRMPAAECEAGVRVFRRGPRVERRCSGRAPQCRQDQKLRLGSRYASREAMRAALADMIADERVCYA